ncbi:histidine kinase [uncultured Croceitalea sp.]|uniref:tetratricopeptide repeat-containing sensor histidine kinase n=1 Tax=uncultured Croceitalea sp. TaxID=1798908 RepID=UPI00374F2894
MFKKAYIIFFLLLTAFSGFSQVQNRAASFQLKGYVRGQDTYEPISGVQVTTDSGSYTTTNALGEFKIKASIGDIIIFESPEFETVRRRITSNEDIGVQVKNYSSSKRKVGGSKSSSNYISYLDSAEHYREIDIEKSIDFVTQSISGLGSNPNKTDLAKSLRILGEIYMYHKQYDLAITNFNDAQKAQKNTKTSLSLAEAYIKTEAYELAGKTLQPLLKLRKIVPYQRIQLYELLGDSSKGMNDTRKALEFYQEGLKIAQKNQVSPKVTDLNSKIADTYAQANREIEAEGYFNNSLKLSRKETPTRAIQENEKVADFYNKSNRFGDEIQLRKKSLNELNQLPKKAVAENKGIVDADSITSQRINYKIANAYIAQEKLDEAIPYLEKSIVEADSEDDLVVQKDATRKLSEVFEFKGDFVKAYNTYQNYVALVDTLYIRKEQEISRAARLNREIATKQNRISSLEQERELSQSKYSLALTEQELFEENNKRQKWVIYSLLLGMLLFALAAFFYYRSNRQQKLANNLLALKSLRSQMNPHFIFNALNSVNNYIAKSDERNANRFLSDFSVLMRTVLENSEEDFIPLSKELELLELYVKLEHSRFPDKFDYQVNIEEAIDINSFEIPPMLLQPYIENAIWHGLRYKEEKGFLQINVSQLTNQLIQIEILDNGIGRKKSAALKTENQKKQKSKGMGNIRKRITILNDMYKNKVDVSISDLQEDETGTKVILKLKKD